MRVDNTLMMSSFTRTLRFKVRPESYGWLSAAAVEVNQVFNFCNETSLLAVTRTDLRRKWLTGYERAARFDSLQRATLVFDRNTRVEHDPHGALRKLWLDMPPAMSVLG